MPSSPQTPRHSRHPSSFDASYQYSPSGRRQSRSSNHDPATPIRHGFNNDSLDLAAFSGGGPDAGNGLGNLADELADAFSDSNDEGDYYEEEDTINDEAQATSGREGIDGIRDSGVDVADSGSSNKKTSLSPPSPTRRGHRRKGSEYDGSEYGSGSDFETAGMPSGLIAKMDAVEALARRGAETNGGPTDTVFERVTDGLKDLGSQAGVEGSATR